MDQASPYVRLYTLSFTELFDHVRSELDKFRSYADFEKYNDFFNTHLCSFRTELLANPGGPALNFVNDSFVHAFDELLMLVFPFLHVKIADYSDELLHNGIEWDDAYNLITGYKEASQMFGEHRHDLDLYFSRERGWSFEFEKFKIFMNQLATDKAKEGAELLGIQENREKVLRSYERVLSVANQFELHDQLVEYFEIICQLNAVLFSIGRELYPDFSDSISMRHVKPDEILVPILQLREYQEMVEKFSYNDFTHVEFEQMITRFLTEKKYRIGNVLKDMWEYAETQFKPFQEALNLFLHSPFSDQFIANEKKWYCATELLLISFEQCPGLVYCNNHEELIERYNETPHADAMYELEEFIAGPESYYHLGIERGAPLYQEHWANVRRTCEHFGNREYLETVGGTHLYEEAAGYDNESIYLASLIVSEEALYELREMRADLSPICSLLMNSKLFAQESPSEEPSSETE